MWKLVVYGAHKLQEMRKRPVRLTELLDVYYLLQKRFGVTLYDTEEEYVEALERLVEMGYLEKSSGGYAVTETGRRAAESLKCPSSGYMSLLKEYMDKTIDDYTYMPPPCKNK